MRRKIALLREKRGDRRQKVEGLALGQVPARAREVLPELGFDSSG
jgi:hypothetical protein